MIIDSDQCLRAMEALGLDWTAGDIKSVLIEPDKVTVTRLDREKTRRGRVVTVQKVMHVRR